MSFVVEDPPRATMKQPDAGTGSTDVSAAPDAAGLPDASVLEDKTPIWFRLPAISATFVLTIGSLFLILANRRLWHTDLWDHLNYGRNVIQQQKIPLTEPLLVLAQGMPMVNIPWLAQIGMSLLFDFVGPAALQFAYAMVIAISVSVIAWTATQRTGSAFGGFVAVAIFFVLNYHQFMIIRPQLVGVLFFCITVMYTQGSRSNSRLIWFGLPMMFALWANCHGSFSIGLVTLMLTAVGRFCDVVLRSRSVRLAVRDQQMLRILLLTQLCTSAVLLNPAGLAIYPEVFRVAESPNVQSMFEWNPLTLRMNQGQWAAGITILALVSMKLTPRRVTISELLPVLATGLLTLWSARMMNWWAPLMAIVTTVHLTATLRLFAGRHRQHTARRRSGLWTVVNVGLCWIIFSLTNLGVQLVHGRVPELSRVVSKQTPVQLVTFLSTQQELPAGITFVPAEWAGYVMHAGPSSVSSMVNLHVHVLPEEVWNDYLRLLQGGSDWQAIFDQYGVNLAIIDRTQQPAMLRRLSESDLWSALYSDHQAVLFRRNQPI